MKMTIRKWFWAWEFEKEENWLNDLSAQGLHLVGVSFCTYVFEKGAPSEYTVRLQMLDSIPRKSLPYVQLVEESGAEYIGSISRWAYFRKKASQEEFQVFSDIDSRIRHVNGLLWMLVSILFLNAMLLISHLMHLLTESSPERMYSIASVLLGGVICLLGYAVYKVVSIRNKLQKERVLRE